MFTIRKGGYSDKETWIGLRKALWPDCPENRHELEINHILSSQGIVLIAESSSQSPVGFAEISRRGDHVSGTFTTPTAYLEGWYVAPAYRRQGIGKALIRSAEEFALQAGFTELASDAEMNNHEGIEIHNRLGFIEVERTVHLINPLTRKNS
jgi:aminoglycoside 6'-N-acetyltransferase I